LGRSFFNRIKAALMPGFNLFASLLQQYTAQGTRATILNPLGWFFGMCVLGMIAAVRSNSSFWIQLLLGCFSSLSGIVFLGTYVFCLLTKRENLLRTEKFLIQQLAIEKGFRGDSSTGIALTSDAKSAHLIDDVGNQTGSEQE
jgi:hypothetical protein